MAAGIVRKSAISFISSYSSFLCKSNVYFSTERVKPYLNSSTISEFLMCKHDFSPESAGRVGSVLTRLKSLDNADLVLSFLKEIGFSSTQLEKTATTIPAILSSKLEKTIKPKIMIFRDLGFSDRDIAEILSKQPSVLHRYAPDSLITLLSGLMGLLGSSSEVCKILKVHGVFSSNSLVPNVEFLKSCGVSDEQIVRVANTPRFLSLNPEKMRKCVEKADEMGFDRSSRMFIYAVRVVSSMSSETWELKMTTFREFGFSEDDILRVFRYIPTVFTKSEKKIRKVVEVLVGTGKYDMSCIINNPNVFTYSVERRLRPRVRVLGVLEKKNLIKEWPKLAGLYLLTDAGFFEKFVAPYVSYVDEVDELWSTLVGKENLKNS